MAQSQDEQWLLKEKYHGEKSDAFFADCKRLTLGEPLAYLIGWTPFLDTKIYLDSQPLIPRPETEYWTKEAIDSMSTRTTSLGLGETEPLRVLDLCAGSGAIGIAVAKAVPDALVDFGEIEPAHLPTIEKNLTENNIAPERVTVLHSHLFDKVTGRYDYILTNPPYIDPALDRAEPSVKLHEPHLALYGGHAGMEVIAQIISTATDHLNSNGQLWIEHEPEQMSLIAEGAAMHGFSATTHKDQYGANRYSVLVLQ